MININTIGIPMILFIAKLGCIIHNADIRDIDNNIVNLFLDFFYKQIYKNVWLRIRYFNIFNVWYFYDRDSDSDSY